MDNVIYVPSEGDIREIVLAPEFGKSAVAASKSEAKAEVKAPSAKQALSPRF